MNVKTDVLIIGGGPAGIQASRMLKTLHPPLDVVVLRPEQYSMIYCAIPYVLEGLVEPKKSYKKDELITSVAARLFKERAVSVDFDANVVKTDADHTFYYKTLLIATGANPFVPMLKGKELERILTVKTGSDMQNILDLIEAGAKSAVVIGAGAIGIEQALAYRRRGMEVHLVDMASHPLPAMLDVDFAESVTNILEQEGIKLYLGRKLVSFEGRNAVRTVVLDDGTTIKLNERKDFVIVSVGVKPNLDLFVGTDLEIGPDGLIINKNALTNREGVYAAGDCCQYYSGIDGKAIGGKLATNAVPMAKVAALNILGFDAEFPGLFNGAVTITGELRVGGTGFTEKIAKQRGLDVSSSFGETTTRFPMMPGAGKVKVKLVYENNTKRIVGGQVIGAEAVAERIDIITFAIQHRMTVSELSGLSYCAQPWQTFFPARNAIVSAATTAFLKSKSFLKV